MTLKSETVLSWLIPSFLGALIGILGWMALGVHELSRNMALMIYRVDNVVGTVDMMVGKVNNHEARLNSIENQKKAPK